MHSNSLVEEEERKINEIPKKNRESIDVKSFDGELAFKYQAKNGN